MRSLSQFVSILFHPVWMILAFALLVYRMNPYSYSFHTDKDFVLIFVMIGVITILFPLLSIFMLKWIGILNSLEMDERKQRIVPLVLTGMYYMWLYANIRHNTLISEYLVQFTLGSTIAIFIAFIINIFSKISLHSVGIAGFLMGVFVFKYHSDYQSLIINLPVIGGLVMDVDLLIVLLVLISGLVGTARLYLDAHKMGDITGGYIVGILGQLIAMRIIF